MSACTRLQARIEVLKSKNSVRSFVECLHQGLRICYPTKPALVCFYIAFRASFSTTKQDVTGVITFEIKLYFTKSSHSLSEFSGCRICEVHCACIIKPDCQFFSLISVSFTSKTAFFKMTLG